MLKLWKTITLALLVSLIACSKKPGQKSTDQRYAPADMGVVKEAELEVRNQGEPDNWKKSALYLTDYDKNHNITILYINSNYRVSHDPTTVLAESCSRESICGFVKADPDLKLEAISTNYAHQKIKDVGVKSHYDMPNDGTFAEGEVWIMTSIDPAQKWGVTIAIELADFKPKAKKVLLKYRVLEYRRI